MRRGPPLFLEEVRRFHFVRCWQLTIQGFQRSLPQAFISAPLAREAPGLKDMKAKSIVPYERNCAQNGNKFRKSPLASL